MNESCISVFDDVMRRLDEGSGFFLNVGQSIPKRNDLVAVFDWAAAAELLFHPDREDTMEYIGDYLFSLVTMLYPKGVVEFEAVVERCQSAAKRVADSRIMQRVPCEFRDEVSMILRKDISLGLVDAYYADFVRQAGIGMCLLEWYIAGRVPCMIDRIRNQVIITIF